MKKILLILMLSLFLISYGLTADDWQSPTGHIAGSWSDEEDAYDDDTESYAQVMVGPFSWGAWIELTIGSMSCDKVRFWAYYDAMTINAIDLEVYYDGDYQSVYIGAYTHDDWEEKSLGDTYSVTKVRMRFANSFSSPVPAVLVEFDFNQVETGWPHKWNTKEISKWNTKEFTKWNGLE